jgi:hypothetical protein
MSKNDWRNNSPTIPSALKRTATLLLALLLIFLAIQLLFLNVTAMSLPEAGPWAVNKEDLL